LAWTLIAMCFGLASCSPARRTIIRNATGADIMLWPLSARPMPLKAGETTDPIVYWAHERHEALIERGNCLYTYPAPDYSELPKSIRDYKAITVVIREDMRLSVHQRSKEGVEGPEIAAPGFPLAPITFCGRRGGRQR
jgi:hypothetical protein